MNASSTRHSTEGWVLDGERRKGQRETGRETETEREREEEGGGVARTALSLFYKHVRRKNNYLNTSHSFV